MYAKPWRRAKEQQWKMTTRQKVNRGCEGACVTDDQSKTDYRMYDEELATAFVCTHTDHVHA